MNKLFKTFSILAVIALFTTACGAQIVQAQPAEAAPPQAVTYETVLSKSLNDKDVADLIARENCSRAAQFQLCRSSGLVLSMGADEKIQSVFLYPGGTDGFSTYQGQLPFGLRFTDTMETVEQKLGYPVEIHAPQAGWIPRLPDEGVTPDHFRYVATYEDFGLTVIYNSPSANDKSAGIHALLVSKWP